ncbi:hypothetical protein BT63DRAFT_451258 [Microthyrium microscopicum]|uniref:Uncharacterized protein n=1 Tax=Microthyrium microscopicum TaxID=703497 RepID=A0A6A6UQM2_9PEZI|nr:hypothetical protein BT63DRAFT_451258 [Microthyrium microscopicum]
MRFHVSTFALLLTFFASLATAVPTTPAEVVTAVVNAEDGANIEAAVKLLNASNVFFDDGPQSPWNMLSVDTGHWSRAEHFAFLTTGSQKPLVANSTNDAKAIGKAFSDYANIVDKSTALIADTYNKYYKKISSTSPGLSTQDLRDYANQTMFQTTYDLFGTSNEIAHYLKLSLVNFPNVEKSMEKDYDSILKSANKALVSWGSFPLIAADNPI